MEQAVDSGNTNVIPNTQEISIFDELQPLPLYYSEKAVYVFSILFGVLFGSILMAINFSHTPKKKGTWQVLVFGFLLTVIQVSASYLIPKANSGLTIVMNILGAAILKQFFWEKFIGKNVAYTKKPVLIPTIIGIILAALILFAALSPNL